MTRFAKRLGVITHVPHWLSDGRPLAYEPYVREMDVWSRLFEKVVVVAPRDDGPPTGNQAVYAGDNVEWRPVRYSMGWTGLARWHRLAQMPAMAAALNRLLTDCDVVLLRSPGHPALVGRILARVRRRPTITKWAGFFGAFEGERLPSRVERRMVQRDRWPVLVYGNAPLPHLVPFSPALMTEVELDHAAALGRTKNWSPPWKILSVGRVLPVKGFDLALAGLGQLRTRAPHLDWQYTLVGDGPALAELRANAERRGIADRVTFTGALPFSAAQAHYGAAHIVIMPGVKEGWPKPIAEAWAHGALPVAAAAGIVPWIIEEGGVGTTFPPTADGLYDALRDHLEQPDALAEEASRGFVAARHLSLEAFADNLERVLVHRLGLQ